MLQSRKTNWVPLDHEILCLLGDKYFNWLFVQLSKKYFYFNTVYREIFVPFLFSTSLSAGKFKTGRISIFQVISLVHKRIYAKLYSIKKERSRKSYNDLKFKALIKHKQAEPITCEKRERVIGTTVKQSLILKRSKNT